MPENSPALLAAIPHIDQYFGLWAMHEAVFLETVARFQAMDLAAHLAAQTAAGKTNAFATAPYEVTDDGVAMIEINGTLTKYGSSLAPEGGTLGIRKQIRAAIADDRVGAICLRIDSPGGAVAGTGDLADEVANSTKPVTAYIEDMAASGAYWIASQADEIIANPSAWIGSIGAYGVIRDYSATYAKDGIKTHVIRSAAMKGAGTPGTEVTPEHLADAQRQINAIHALFTGAVARGRNLPADQVAALSDGRVHLAADAQKAGLIDRVGTLDMARAAAAGRMRPGTTSPARMAAAPTEETDMSKPNEVAPAATTASAAPSQPAAATFSELKAALPKATAEFRESCQEKGLTLAQAKDAYMAHLDEQLAASQTRIADLQKSASTTTATTPAAAAAPAATRPGVQPVADTRADSEADGSATDRWNAAIDREMKHHAGNRSKAIAAAVRKNPELHAEYLEEYNTAHASARR